MFERLFAREWVCKMHSGRHCSEILQNYSYRLLDVGHRKSGISKSLLRWEAFLFWLYREKMDISDATEAVVEDFIEFVIEEHIQVTENAFMGLIVEHYKASLRKLLRFLREDKIIPPAENNTLPRWYSSGLQEYASFLSLQTGITDKSVRIKIREAEHFLDFLKVYSWKDLPGNINVKTIDKYFIDRTSSFSMPRKRGVASSMRSILRYWHMRELMTEDLSWLVPFVHSYRLATVPRFISWDDVQRLLLVFDRKSKVGRRNYLILLLLSTYGWRSIEVARLTLDDIVWKRNTIMIRHTKTAEFSTYPLLPSVGDALIDYLKNARPDSRHREVMLCSRAPFAPFSSGGRVGDVVTFAFQLAKIKTPVPKMGAHIIRHSYAIRMLDHGMPMKTISDMLGHKRLSSTEIYTKVDLKRMHDASLEVVGEI